MTADAEVHRRVDYERAGVQRAALQSCSPR